MDEAKNGSSLVKHPWILLVAVLIGWFGGTVYGYARAYSDGATNVFDIYADLATLVFWLGIAGFWIMSTYYFNHNPAYIYNKWADLQIFGILFITTFMIIGSGILHDNASYLNNDFKDFGQRSYQLSQYRGYGPHSFVNDTPAEIRLKAAGGKCHWEFVVSMPKELLDPDDKWILDHYSENTEEVESNGQAK